MRRRLAKVQELGDELDRKRRDREERFSAGGYQSAESSRDAHSWLTSRLSPDSALEEDRQTMIERADSAIKNFELADNHVEGRVIRVAGSGMTVQPEIGVEREDASGAEQKRFDQWNQALRVSWERVCERIGKSGEELWEIQHAMQRSWEDRGEWFVMVGDEYDPLSPLTMKVEVLNPDLIFTPCDKAGDASIRMGIQLDDSNRPIGCYLHETHPGDTLKISLKYKYEEFYQPNGLPRIIHHFAKRKRGQHRGFPRMQVGTKRLKNAEEYAEAELERNYVAACHTAFVRSDVDAEDFQGQIGVCTDSSGRKQSQLAPGKILSLGPADTVEFSSPSGPTATFTPYMDHEGRMFAAGCGTAYELLSNDWRGLSYSTARVLWNIEDATSAVMQLGHEKTIKWIYRHFVTRAIIEGIIDADILEYRSDPWSFWSARIIYPPKASIDPAREDRNEMVQVEGCMIPASEMVERLNGKPARQVYAAIERDRKDREKYGLEVHMPQMGRDAEVNGVPGGSGPTQPGDTNQASSDANSDRQATGAAA